MPFFGTPTYRRTILLTALLLLLLLLHSGEVYANFGSDTVAVSADSTGMTAHTSDHRLGWMLRGAAGTAGELPFWMHSNRYGEPDRYSANALINLFGNWGHTFGSGITLSAGGDLLFRGSGDSAVRFQQGYVEAGYGGFLLTAGRKIETFGFVHPDLSMGTVDLSRNARPMPKISLSTDGFQPVPGTGGTLSFDASLAHGWMEDTEHRFVDGVLLHQKHLYLRLWEDDARFSPRIGLTHFAQWGGESPVRGGSDVNFRTFMDVFLSRASDSREMIGGGELENRFQNHFGAYDVALWFNIGGNRMSVSRQFILEDTPNAKFVAPWDGMWSVWLDRTAARHERPVIQAVLYEFIYTLDGLTREPRNHDMGHVNYYNHSTYNGGWTYGGRSLGNPLFVGDRDHYGVVNNQLIGHHLGMKGHAGAADWRLFATYSRNYGASRARSKDDIVWVDQMTGRKDQWSFMLELSTGRLIPDLETAATFALDLGDVHPRQAGVMMSVKWEM